MIRVVEWFGGIGAFTKAMTNNSLKYEIVDYVEIDKNAVKSYNAIHGTNFKPMDIKNVMLDNYTNIDYLIAGWPCQDLSTAGKQAGIFEGNRSNLILLTIAKIREMKDKPKHIVLENVKGLLSEKFKDQLAFIRSEFESIGYVWNQVLLNSKYFGVAQSRERVFIVLSKKAIDLTPLLQRKKVEVVLKDILDFNLQCETVKLKIEDTKEYTNFVVIPRESDGKVINGFHNRLWKDSGTSGTLTASATPKVYITNTMKQYTGKDIEVDIQKLQNQNPEEINKVATLGVLNDTFQEHSFNQKKDFLGVEGVSKTLRAGDCDSENKVIWQNEIEIKYRKLHAKECLYLMGFYEGDYRKLKAVGVSDSQICKQADNSIVVKCLEALIHLVERSN
jgi:DNA-cytosine methyltransferase